MFFLILQLLTLLGTSRRILITVGWIKGVRNVMADAISRNFLVSNGDALKRGLLANTKCPSRAPTPRNLSSAIKAVSAMKHHETSTIIRWLHIVMAAESTSASAPSSTLSH
jgi:hypothetical protein